MLRPLKSILFFSGLLYLFNYYYAFSIFFTIYRFGKHHLYFPGVTKFTSVARIFHSPSTI